MNWEQLLSLKRQGDTNKRLRNEQDEMIFNFITTLVVSHFTPKPSLEIQKLVEKIREP